MKSQLVSNSSTGSSFAVFRRFFLVIQVKMLYRSFDGRRIPVKYEFCNICYSKSSETIIATFYIEHPICSHLRLWKVICRSTSRESSGFECPWKILTVGLFSNKIYNDNYAESSTFARSINLAESIQMRSNTDCLLLLCQKYYATRLYVSTQVMGSGDPTLMQFPVLGELGFSVIVKQSSSP